MSEEADEHAQSIEQKLDRCGGQYRRIGHDLDVPGVVSELAESQRCRSGHVDRLGQEPEVDAQVRPGGVVEAFEALYQRFVGAQEAFGVLAGGYRVPASPLSG